MCFLKATVCFCICHPQKCFRSLCVKQRSPDQTAPVGDSDLVLHRLLLYLHKHKYAADDLIRHHFQVFFTGNLKGSLKSQNCPCRKAEVFVLCKFIKHEEGQGRSLHTTVSINHTTNMNYVLLFYLCPQQLSWRPA